MTYEDIKDLQRVIKLERCRKPPVTDLLVLAPENDPYYAGGPPERASRRNAELFAGLWERFGFITGVHLRRIHYRIVS